MYNFNLLAGYSPQFLKKSQMVPLTLARKKYPRPSLKEVSICVCSKEVYNYYFSGKEKKIMKMTTKKMYKDHFSYFFSPTVVTCRYSTTYIVPNTFGGNEHINIFFRFHSDNDCFS